MTVAAINTQILSTTLYKSQTESAVTNINNERAQIAYQTTALIGADWEKDPRVKILELKDQQLELQQKNLETQQKAASAQLESLQKLLDNNIKKDFTINLSA